MTPPTNRPSRAAHTRQRHLGRSAALSAGGTILSRFTGLLRLIVIAYTLGSANLADAFNLSNNTPNMIHDLVLGGVLAATFVPVFVDRLAKVSRTEAAASISTVLTLSLIVLSIATVLFELLAPAIIDLYTVGLHDLAERAVAVELLRLFAPQLLFYGAISLITAVLATQDRFALAGIVPVINNVVGIVVLASFAALAHTASAQGATQHQSLLIFLGVGTTLGVALQAVALLPSLRRCGLGLHLRFRSGDPAVAMVVSLSSWTLGFVVANQAAVFIVMALAAHLGAVSIYTYAFTFFQMPFAIAATSIIAVATPEIARAHVQGDRSLVGTRFGRATAQVLTVILPATVGYLLLGRAAMTLVLRHGHLSASGAHLTGSVLIDFSLGLPAFCLFFLATRTFQAIHEPRTTFLLYLLENGTNIVLAFVLFHRFGVQGLALSYSIAYTLAAAVAIVLLRKRLGTIGGTAIRQSVLRAVGLSIVMAFVVAFVVAVLGIGSGLGGWVKMALAVIAGLGAYLIGAGVASAIEARRAPKHAVPAVRNATVVPMANYQRGSIADRNRDRQLKRLAPVRLRARGRYLRSTRRPPWR